LNRLLVTPHNQRFIAGFIIIINESFNINTLHLSFLVAIGISNLKATFSLTFNYCLLESEEAFGFFFNLLKEVVFVEQVGGAAAKHSTRRTTSVKKCVDSI
jgi:hypothetical protein